MEDVSFRVSAGDKIGLVGRNGAGKTTLTKTLAGETMPTHGQIDRSGQIGYLPQDPRSGEPTMLARTRILDARGLGTISLGLYQAGLDMGSDDPKVAAKAMKVYGNLTDQFNSLGGYAAEAEAASIASNLNLPDRILDQEPADALRRPAPPHRARPHPLLRRGNDDPRRTDQPPRRRFRRLAP
nr:ATP-binding cassette domain-containing protein [Cryobacterium breve]